MHFASAVLVAVAILVAEVAAHGYVPQLKIGNASSPVGILRKPVRVVRGTKLDSGYISDVTSPDITCSIGNKALPPAPITATVVAGQTVEMLWNTWPLGHYGPVMNYMAKCAGVCSSFKGDSGSPWFKISQSVYNNGVWASDALANNNHSWTVTIPSNIAPGDYLLRHEILALHAGSNLNGAQFYPVCVQLTVTGGGSLTPSGLSFPGTYKNTDPGILFNVYQGDAANKAYVAPGGPVYPGLAGV